MIKPTAGRVVWYHPDENDPTPIFKGEVLAAHIARVLPTGEVNLLVIRADGITYGRHNIRLVQDGEKPPAGRYCEWPKGQAARNEQLEKAAAFARREPMPLA
jgi:hypothetical protein